MDDDDIREGLRAGDLDRAFRLLRSRYGGLVYHVCRDVLRNDSLVEDASQEAFAKAYRDRARLAAADSVKAYFSAIARNAALDMLRKARRRRALDHEHEHEQHDGEAFVTPRFAPAVEPAESAALRECLEAMDPITRDAFCLHFQDGLPWHDVAIVVDLPIDTIRMRVTRALVPLRHCILAKGVTP